MLHAQKSADCPLADHKSLLSNSFVFMKGDRDLTPSHFLSLDYVPYYSFAQNLTHRASSVMLGQCTFTLPSVIYLILREEVTIFTAKDLSLHFIMAKYGTSP